MEWPITSPTTSATRLPGSGIASYQSPPTRAVSAARQVPRRQPDAGAARQGLRQHRALELVRDVRLTPVQHGLVDAEGAVRGELRRDQQVVGLERDALGTAQEQRGADHPAASAQRRENRALAVRDGRRALLAEEFGQRRPRGRGVREHRTDPAQHLGERAAGPHRAQLLADRVQLGRLLRRRDRHEPAALGVPLGGNPVGAAQPQHQRARGPLVADRQRVAQIHQDRVGEGRHGRPAQPHDDLVQVDAAGDPPGGRADEAQPVPVPPHGRGAARPSHLARAALLADRGPVHPALPVGGLHRDAVRRGPRTVGVRLRVRAGARLGVLGRGTVRRVGRRPAGGDGAGRGRLTAGAPLCR
ncbi:hypothetical protein LUX34_12345 [Streptomyces werraensis]|nr:hypothetical protein [Streptomyces werraensis]